MNESQYVQHKSGHGEKWPLVENLNQDGTKFIVYAGFSMCTYELPKSEYVPCDPPERWEDVTSEYAVANVERFVKHNTSTAFLLLTGDRWKKITLASFKPGDTIIHECAFIIERKVKP